MEGQSRYVELAGVRFHYLEYGDPSQRPLVFLHGIFSSAADYESLLQPLAEHRRVLAPDQRGHGQTDHATEYTWAGLAEDLDAFTANIGLHSFDLVGYSMGAFAAARYAGTHPASIQHLVLIEGGLEPPDSPEAPAFWGKVGALLVSPEGHPSSEAFVEAAAAAFPRASRAALTEAAERLVRRPDGWWERPPTDLNVASLAAKRSEDQAAIVAAIKVPTLILRGEHSELFVPDGFKHLAGTMERAEIEIIEGCGHLFMWENVDGVVKRIERFLNAHV